MKGLRKVKKSLAMILLLAVFVTTLSPASFMSAKEIVSDKNLSKVAVLAANVYYEATGENVFTPYTTKELTVAGQKLKVGILGIENTDCSRFDVPGNYPGMVFAHPDNKKLSIAWEVNRYVPKMKEEGCEFIIVSYHAGLGTVDGELEFEKNTENQVARMIAETENVDVVVAGHDHSTAYSNTYIKNKNKEDVLVVNAGGTSLTNTVFEVTYDEEQGFSIGLKKTSNVDLASYQDDKELASLLQPAVDKASEYVNQQCGVIKDGNWTTSTNFYLEQTDTMDLINRAQMIIADKYIQKLGYKSTKMSSTSVVVNGKYTVQPGNISLKDIYTLYKYENYLYVVPLTGKEIKTWLEGNAEDHFSYTFKNGAVKFATAGNSFTNPVFYGIDFEYDLAKDVGSRVANLKFADGSEVKDEETYNVAVNSYHIGQDPFTRTGKTTDDAIWSSKDALGDDKGTVQSLIAEYIKDCTAKDGGVVKAPSNWRLTYTGEIPEESQTVKQPVEIYDPISDKMIADHNATSVKDAADKDNGNGIVVGQIVYKYNSDKSIILEDVINGQLYGYQVYDNSGKNQYDIGSVVKVTGTFGSNYGVPQIVPSDVEVLDKLGSEFTIAPQVVTVAELDEDYMNEYVTIQEATLGASDGSYMTVKDATGDIKIYKGASTSYAGSKTSLDITGVCSYYSTAGVYQLRTGSSSDYREHAVIDPVDDAMVTDGVVTLKEVYSKEKAETVTTIGQVTYKFSGSNGAEGNKTTIILQDVIGGEITGLQVYTKDHFADFYIGDVVKVTGTVGEYGGVKQITPSEVERVAVKQNFQPQVVNVEDLDQDYLSEYVTINDVQAGEYSASGNTSISKNNKSINIFKGAAYPENVGAGDTIDVKGICSAYNGVFQIRVGNSADYIKKKPAKEEDTSLLRIPVFETSDLHGSLVDTSSGNDETYQYRLARIADEVNDRRKEKGDVLLLDGGDIYQGTPLSNLLEGKPMIAAYDAMKYDAVSIGNHEFDWEVTKLIDPDGTMGTYALSEEVKGDSQIPVLCNDIYYADTKESVNFTQDYTIVQKTAVSLDGKEETVRIGIIGYVEDYSSDIMASKIAPYIISEEIQKVESQAADLKINGKVDAVVLVTHGGASKIATQLDKDTKVDLVAGGHSHVDVTGTASNGVAYIQPKNAAQSYAYTELCINPTTKEVTVENSKTVSIVEDKTTLYDKEENQENLDEAIVNISKLAIEQVEPILKDRLGYITTPLTKDVMNGTLSSTAGMWMADLMNRATDSKVSFTNNGGIRTSFTMEEGADTRYVTRGDIYTIAPFSNQLYVYDVTYASLKEVLDFTVKSANSLALRMSGVTAYYKGDTVHTVVMDGETIYEDGSWVVDEKTPVRICTNQYIGTSAGTPFINWQPVSTSAIDNESFMEVLEKEGKENDGKLAVRTEANMIQGDYVKDVAQAQTLSLTGTSSQTEEFVLLTTTDIHGKCWNVNILNDTAVNNSLLRVSTVVKQVREQYGDNVILIDNGDLYQGTPISSYNIQCGGDENPMALALKYIGYDVSVLGNHEFNYSFTTMSKIYKYLQTGEILKPETSSSPAPSTTAPSPSVVPTKTPTVTVKPTPVAPKKVNVTLHGNGGYFVNAKETTSITKSVVVNKKYGSLKMPVRRGYLFRGWYTAKTGGKKVSESTVVTNTKSHTLYAQWTKVEPGKTKIVSLKNTKKKNVEVKMDQVKGVKGYQIVYSKHKDFKNPSWVRTTSSVKKLTRLKKGQTYYFKVRTFKQDSTGKNVYSGWSKVKSHKTSR